MTLAKNKPMTDFEYDPMPLDPPPRLTEGEMLRSAIDYCNFVSKRRTVRDFSPDPIDRAVIESCLVAAGSAPSGANHQPWHFVCINDGDTKRAIRAAAEAEERAFYGGRAGDVWLSDLKKIGGSKLKIWESTAEQLRSVDIGSWFDPKFSDQRVPLLSEVLAICKDRVKLNIELKYYGHDQQLEQRVVDLVKAADMESDIVVMSLKQSGIDKIRQIEPDWTVGLLTAVAIGDLTRSNVDFLAVNTGFATRSFVRSAHNSDEQVYVWTVNDRVTMSTMIGRGIDNLITDKPALAKSVLKQRAELSTIERLMIEVASLLGASPATNQNIESF